jgi:hypothetical protein
MSFLAALRFWGFTFWVGSISVIWITWTVLFPLSIEDPHRSYSSQPKQDQLLTVVRAVGIEPTLLLGTAF